MICANCNGLVETNFCPSCGQKKDIHRISVRHVLHEGFHSITHADKGFLLLLKDLLSRPGYVAKEYIDGKRKRYFNPLSFLVISSAIFAYFGNLTGFMEKLTGGGGAPRAGGRPISEEWREVFYIASHHGKWLTLFLIAPLFAFLSWLFFIRKKYNYAENFVLHAFIFGEAAIFRVVVFVPLFLLFPDKTFVLNMYFYEVIFMTFVVIAYKQFFQQHLAFVIVKAVLTRVLFVLLFWALIYGYVVVKGLVF
jgi:hypothetical protein